MVVGFGSIFLRDPRLGQCVWICSLCGGVLWSLAASMIEMAEAAFEDLEHRSAHIGWIFTGPRTPSQSCGPRSCSGQASFHDWVVA
jgi:hypothetical protein